MTLPLEELGFGRRPPGSWSRSAASAFTTSVQGERQEQGVKKLQQKSSGTQAATLLDGSP